MRLYSELAAWWPLLSPADDYAQGAEMYWRTLSQHAQRPVRTLLELGSGGGSNAAHLKRHCQITLTDRSPRMLDVSRRANPECEHILGDMLTLRLADARGGRRHFDAVLVHDAVMYQTTPDGLARVMATAFAHCAPGAAALFAPDYTRETWRPSTGQGGHDGDGRALRFLDWTWDPDPNDCTYWVEIALLLREPDGKVTAEYERHELGLFARDEWLRLLREAGFDAERDADPFGNDLFIARKPADGDSAV